MKENFENGYQDLTMLQGVPEAIEAFTTAYETLLNEVKSALQEAKALEDVTQAKAQGKRLKELLLKQVGYVKGLKDEAMVDEFETIDNDTGAKA